MVILVLLNDPTTRVTSLVPTNPLALADFACQWHTINLVSHVIWYHT